MTTLEAPAKLNLSLLVSPPRDDGYHPLMSLVQTIEWCDTLEVERWEDEDDIDTGIEDDLVVRALETARDLGSVPPLRIVLEKEIPLAAGLGGGSSDAAAALFAATEFGELTAEALFAAAARIGSDVPLFLIGGTLMMTGVGDRLEETSRAGGFAVAVVVPEFGLSTRDVYEHWDVMEGATGDPVADDLLPPTLRGRMPMRNDLLPAALELEPRLGDFIADLSSLWGTTVCLTGAGSACFGYFPSLDEASDAAAAVAAPVRAARGVVLRDRGVASVLANA